MSIRRIKFLVQFDGQPYRGWQAQAEGPTVQGTIEAALSRLLGEQVRVFSAGRTDAGVHAAAMPAHFDTAHPMPIDRLPIAIARYLPDSISVLSAEEVAPDFDVRRAARLRWYRYQILMAPLRRPLGARSWRVHRPLDLDAIEAGLALLRGSHDFQGFRSSICQASRTRLTLQEARLWRGGAEADGGLIAIDFKCRSFLHHMVRFMVGTLVSMGHGQIDPARLLRIRDDFNRPQLVLCAPPEGLCLMAVGYTPEECTKLLAAAPPPPSF